MKKYRTKNKQIDAVQFSKENMADVAELFQSLENAPTQNDFHKAILSFSDSLAIVGTDDYIYINEQGMPAVIRQDVFENNYEEE